MYYTYALQSQKDNGFYIGISSNPGRRLIEHNMGKTRSTRLRRPFKLIYQKAFATRPLARQHELYLKSGAGRESLKLLYIS